ncbi:amidohydrolase family protein [Kutzneria viridogrisea]|uniref:Tol biopolymer transport system component n=1 Tax=Kutzneria viridogrisea TaxID=47990 RepID=A0ABR6BVA4_9PSEU|nr:amidohydrolase family protein [Kutzneria albida]MBA8930844.1 Tol biopolymer transport system component [Kutzneria viridogrisea]
MGGVIRITEGTNFSAAVAPDGSTLVVDLLSRLWILPVTGGPATPLTGELGDATAPDWSPDGTRVAFQSYRTGNFHLWTVTPGGQPRQLTSGPYDHREPVFSPDGTRLAFSADLGRGYGIHVLDLATGRITTWADSAAEEAAPAWSPDGTRLAFTVDGAAVDVVDAHGNRERVVEPTGAVIAAPFWTPDGHGLGCTRFEGVLPRRLAGYARAANLVVGDRVVSTPDEDVFGFRAHWLSRTELLYTADGHIRRRDLATGTVSDIGFEVHAPHERRTTPSRWQPPTGPRPVRGIAGPALSPAGDRVAFCALGELWLMPIGAPARRLTRDGFLVADPAWSPDGRQLAYTTDRLGNPDLWVRELATGAERRITDPVRAAVAPAWSPDGGRIAFQDQDGATFVTTLDGDLQQVLGPQWYPGRVSWSPTGTALAMAVARPYSTRFREGTNQILVLDLRSGEFVLHEPAPHRSLSSRGLDGPVWSPDGSHMAFTTGGRLHVLAVDAEGKPLAEPRCVVDEIADAPSWSGDGRRILYLSNGVLRLVEVSSGLAVTVEVPLTCAPARTTGHTVIHAGRLWDGRSPALREDVDIVVEGDRVIEVGEHRQDRPGRYVDASALTVLPGLADMHVHNRLKGRFLGARQGRLWLSFGITTIRSAGDPVYEALQEQEALLAGNQLGPRCFATGEPIDGSRVYYGFMRPTTSAEEVDRELARAQALGHGLLKAYVRLPVSGQRALVEAARRTGRRVSSHYLHPAAWLGLDGVEHLGASTRLGYSQTITRRGRTYADVVTALTATGMSLTPTLFAAAVLLADGAWLADRRIRTLLPHWEYKALAELTEIVSDPTVRATLHEVLASAVHTLRRVHEGGGLVAAGTDAPIDFVALSLHLNLHAMVANGMSPHTALSTATVNAARVLGASEDLGAVAVGSLADLVFVEGDPLTDITAAAAVRKVMLGGVLHEASDLLRGYP